MRTEVYSIKGFLNGEGPKTVKGSSNLEKLAIASACAGAAIIFMHQPHVFAADPSMVQPVSTAVPESGPISIQFDKKIWPLLLDLGKPLAKTMIAIGIYKCIRNDVVRGWQMCYRSGLGLAALYLVDGAIHLISGVGQDLSQS